jgi:hypothetical protein
MRVCSLCTFPFCEKCVTLPALKNMCSNGGKHAFSAKKVEECREKYFFFFRQSLIVECIVPACNRCGEESISLRVCGVCHFWYCEKCLVLPSLKNTCTNGGKHTFEEDGNVTLFIILSFSFDFLPILAVACGRCGVDDVEMKKCTVCMGSYCEKCAHLSALKNMCSDGTKHIFEGFCCHPNLLVVPIFLCLQVIFVIDVAMNVIK